MRPLLLLESRRFCRLLLTAFIIFSSCYISNAQASGRDGESTVTFKGKDVPLSDLFKAIKKQTGYTVMYSLSVTQLDGKEKVTVNFNKAGIVEVMAYVLKGRSLVWTIVDESILIYKEEQAKKNTDPTFGVKKKNDTLINTVLPIVTGRVTDADDKPIPGATVMVKGTRDGTVTDGDGIFSLANININSPLVITSLGYSPREVVVKGKSIQIKMNIVVSDLDETQVIAYGTTTRRLATGNIVTVSAKEIERQPVMNPLQALQGRVPGLVVTQTSGYASAPFKVEIRGRNLINPGVASDPLYIIDGVPLTILDNRVGSDQVSTGFLQTEFLGPAIGQSPFFSINPADIESISVLKDGDATAIYGSRAANGVILITTKKGKPGKTKFDLNMYQGMSRVTRNYKMLNTQQYLEVRREAFYNDSINYGLIPDPGIAPDLLVWDTLHYTDWQKYTYGGIGKTTDVQANLSGGDKITTFRIGAGYHRETDILAVSGSNQRGSVQFNLTHNSLNNRLNVSFTNLYSYTKSDLISVSSSVTLPPNAPAVFNDQGNLNFKGWAPATYLFQFDNLLQPYKAKTSFLNSQIKIRYELINNLFLSVNVGYEMTKNSQFRLYPIISQNPLNNPKGNSQFGNNNRTVWITEPQLEYSRTISKGKFNFLMGATLQEVSQDGNYIFGGGYVNDNLLRSISNAPIKNASDVNLQYKYAAIFGRINYNWLDKYILNLSARRDGSSRFGPGKQFGNFAAIGAAWIFTEEQWMKDKLSFLSFGKIRSSYGLTGSDNLSDYQFLTRWSAADNPTYQGVASYLPLQHANPNLQWQVNKKLEAALNLGFFQDRYNIEASWYRNRCDNQLVYYTLPYITGFTSVAANFPAMVENTGLEILVRGTVLDKNSISWSFNFNIGINKNKLVEFPNLLQSPYAYQYFVGEPLNIRRLLHYTGVDPQTGVYTYEDQNKDGVITTRPSEIDDLKNKDLSVQFDGGFGSDFRYRNWQLNVFFHFRKQQGRNAIYSGVLPGGIGNQSIQVLNRWRKPGDVAKFPRYTNIGDASDYNIDLSDGVYGDASFVRLQNLSVSYDLQTKWASIIGIQAAKIYLRGQNLLVITRYNGVDPETPSFGQMPPSKIFTAGIQLNL